MPGSPLGALLAVQLTTTLGVQFCSLLCIGTCRFDPVGGDRLSEWAFNELLLVAGR